MTVVISPGSKVGEEDAVLGTVGDGVGEFIEVDGATGEVGGGVVGAAVALEPLVAVAEAEELDAFSWT